MPGFNCTNIANNIPEWNNRDMESCCKYCNDWNNYLYVYTNSRPMCNYNNIGSHSNAFEYADF
jgi:hypothetical protein